MNAAAIRVLFDYNAWGHAQVWNGIKDLTEDQFIRDLNDGYGSVRDRLVYVINLDAAWFARLRDTRIPARLKAEDFPTREDVSRLWSVVYSDLDLVLQNLTDEQVADPMKYVGDDKHEHINYGWQILLHIINHGADHRARTLYALHKLGVETVEQDFVYYLRDEMPPRGYVTVSADVLRQLFQYDTYATSRLVAECIAELSESDLDKDMGYAHRTVRAQLAHIMLGGQYWLGRAFGVDIEGNVSNIFSAAAKLLQDTTSKELMQPVEYKTAVGRSAANIRWEMLWHLVNHGTDHRAQTLAMLHDLDAPTFEQSMMVYWWEYHVNDV